MIDTSQTLRDSTTQPDQDLPEAIRDRQAMEALESDAISVPFLGRWNQLISRTNWEKGRIIHEWRQAQQAAGAAPNSYRDDLWAAVVGGITPQHVGRLRRVYERFGDSYASYPQLYWTHFLAALDWDDAEMWLEGASRSQMSVSEMRRTRWQTLGANPKEKPEATDIPSTTVDEDFVPEPDLDSSKRSSSFSSNPLDEGPDFGSPDATDSTDTTRAADDAWPEVPFTPNGVSPLAALPELPADVAEAFDEFKLAIIRHRSANWQAWSRDDALQLVEALRQFILSE